MKQTRKKLTMAALVMLGVLTFGCTELEQPEQTQNNIVTVTTTVNLGVDTKALTNSGVKTFAAGDKIAVIYKDQFGTTQKVVSNALPAGSYGNSATFTVEWKSDMHYNYEPQAGSKVRYIYPAAMAVNNVASMDVDAETTINYSALATQDGELATLATKNDLAVFDGTVPSNAKLPASSTLTNQLAICKFTVKKTGSADPITSSLTEMVINDGTNNYTVKPSSLDTIYVAMRPITNEKTITISAEADGSITKKYKKTITGGKELSANTIVPISVTMIEGALSGKFSVGASKQVCFSQGNLLASTTDGGANWKWQFFNYQYEHGGNATITGGGTVTKNSTNEISVDLFGWSTNTYYGINNSENNNDYYGSFVDWGNLAIVNGGNTANSGWRTLTEEEWRYLFESRTNASYKYGLATFFSTYGLIILPDDYTGTSINTSRSGWGNNIINNTDIWKPFEDAGAVFLPAAGYRQANEHKTDPPIIYWSSTPLDTEKAMSMKASSINLTTGNDSRYQGCSVRLVRDI